MEEKRTRVFVGIPVDSEILDLVTSIPQIADIPARWPRREDLHITILPPWYSDDLEKEKERLRFLKNRFIHFPLFFHTIETTPKNHPRLIWLRGDMIASLVMVKREAELVFLRQQETRQFLPHITLGHVTNPEHVIPMSEPLSVSVIATSLVLYISHLTQEGAWYEQVETIAFR